MSTPTKRRTKRTKRAYVDLYDHPGILFSGCETILFPNGEPEIWIRSADHKHGFRIRADRGPYGLGISVSPFATFEILNNDDPDIVSRDEGLGGTSVVSYDPDPKAQAYKRWYDHQATEADIVLLGNEYGYSR